MKKIIFSLVCSLVLFQQEEPISKVADMQVPVGAQKIEKSAAISYIKSNFKLGNAFNSNDKNIKSIYKINGVIIAFWDNILAEDQPTVKQAPTLEEVKEGALKPFQWSGTLSSVDEANIITVNKNQFFVLKFHYQDEYFYKFALAYKNGKSVCGSFQFKKENKEKADQILSKIIKSISFKK